MRPLIVHGVIGALLLLCCSAARADIGSAESIEWVAASADRVIVGKAKEVNGVRRIDYARYEVVTIDVSETLKGKHEPTATILVRNDYGSPPGIGQSWIRKDVPLVFFLVRPERLTGPVPKGFEWAVDCRGGEITAVYLGRMPRDGSMRVITAAFDVLTEPNAIVSYIDDVLRSIPRDWKQEAIYVPVPTTTMAHVVGGVDRFELRVPVGLPETPRREDPPQRFGGLPDPAKDVSRRLREAIGEADEDQADTRGGLFAIFGVVVLLVPILVVSLRRSPHGN
jgi:hypothetical protein